MGSESSQKFVARNRAPRVQIEYDVEVYGAQKTVQLPFVMGVFADLSGKPVDPLAPVADRKFLEFDVDNFDDRMKSMKPRAAFDVPNTLSGEGNMSIDLSCDSVGRHYPLLLAAAFPRELDGLRLLRQEAGWFARLEDLARRARADADGPAILAQGCRSLLPPRLALQPEALPAGVSLWWREGAAAPLLACEGWPGTPEFAALFAG